jgi:SAM-dependent methyltransferase
MDHQEWNERYAQKELVWSADPNRFLVGEVGGLQTGRALDLGCGEGRNAVWLAERGWHVTAVDFSEVGLEKARQLAGARNVQVDWVLADVTGFQPPAASYDLVLICYLQLPARERHAVMAHARDALVPGGTLLYIGHDLSNLRQGWGGPQDPSVLCTPTDVVADLPGFDILRAEVVQRPVAREPGHGGPIDAIALDALVRATRPSDQAQQSQ